MKSNKDGARQRPTPISSTLVKSRLVKSPKSAISSALSVPITSPTKSVTNHAILKRLPSKGVVGVRSSPNTDKKTPPVSRPRTPTRNLPSDLTKPVLPPTAKENLSLKIEKTVVEQDDSNKELTDDGSLIGMLKSELALKEETIEQLQKQIDGFLKEVEERNCFIEELRQKRGEETDGNKNELTNTEKALWIEIHQLRQQLEYGKSLNDNLQHQMAQKQLEIEQRDKIVTKTALQARDDLLKLLRPKDKAKTGNMTVLQGKLEDHECNADTSEQLQELQSTLEMEQSKVMQLEEQVKQLEIQEERWQYQRTRLEARIAELELALHDKGYFLTA